MTIFGLVYTDVLSFVENNWMVRFLTNELTGIVTEEHLDIAKEIVRRKVLVGLTLDMENSFSRFMHYLGWSIDTLSVDQQQCLNKYIGHGTNQNQHTNEHFGSMGWKILRANNILDLVSCIDIFVLRFYTETLRSALMNVQCPSFFSSFIFPSPEILLTFIICFGLRNYMNTRYKYMLNKERQCSG